MSWLTIGTIVATAILTINAGVYFIRKRRPGEHDNSTSSLGNKKITGVGLLSYSLLVCAFLIGLIVPVVAPSSSFANWLRVDYSLIVYWVWCTVALIPLEVILTLCGFPFWKKLNGAT